MPGVADVVDQLVETGMVFDRPYDLVERPGRELHGAGEIEVPQIRVEDADVLHYLHQSHRDHDRFVPPLLFDQLRCYVGGPCGAPQRDASGVEAVILGERRRGG